MRVIATWLLVTDRFLGLGIGGMERFAAYPLPIWLIAMGIASLRGGPAALPRQPS